ncbi:MAG: TonB-dependent receptor [Bacteroidia bacterium]
MYKIFAGKILALIYISLISTELYSQTLTGSIAGFVTNTYTGQTVKNAEISILKEGEESPVYTTDSDGEFRIINLVVGRYDLLISAEGYQPFIQSGVLVSSGKESLLEISLEETLYDMEEVVLSPDRQKGRPNNEMAMVSAISFEVEETRKFAGGLDDPIRLSANLPGVIATPFISENVISIRGNSPRGMLYRLEGVDIPNPNHFARIGSSAGTFTIFSNQVLANSDFFTGAFPAEYGNATSGVFDIKFRNGNTNRRAYAIQAGVLGIDLAAEGPFRKGGKASYLVNYRYSTFGLANLMINYLTLPTYQDISFKLNMPTEKAGTFGLFGIGGRSNRLREAVTDSSLWEADLDRFENVLASDMAAVGLTHQLLIGQRSVLRSVLVGSYSYLRDNKNYLEDNLEFRDRETNEYKSLPVTFTTSLKHSFSARHTNKTGIILTSTHHDYLSKKYNYLENFLFTRADERGRTFSFQAYSQSKFRFSSKLSANLGVHFLYYDLNDKYSVEPRASLKYQFKPRHGISLGYGLHSRIESFGTYMTRVQEVGIDTLARPNMDLDFVKTHHLVLGYYALISDFLKFRLEGYYQRLFNVPVEVGGTYSVVNIDELNQLRVLENLGTSTNMGIDIGLERFTRKGVYFMVNGSFFDSKYTDAAGVEHSTAFDLGYKVNLLGGKEWRVGKKKGYNNFLGLNGTLSAFGGRPYTPIDLDQSRLYRETIYDETRPYEMRETPLYIFDFTFTYKSNRPRYTGTWAIQIKNLFSSSIPEYREYDAKEEVEVALRGASVLPIISYKIDF